MTLYNDPIDYNSPDITYNGNNLFSKTLTENIGVTENFTRQVSWARALTETITGSETFSRIVNFLRSLSESITGSEIYSRAVSFSRAFTDSISQSETIKKYLNGIEQIWSRLTKPSTSWTNSDSKPSTSWTNPDKPNRI